MKIQLRRVNDAVHFEASNEEGQHCSVDGSPSIGGQGLGLRPMQLVLSALASCAAMDLVEIIKKQRMQLDQLNVEVEGTRDESAIPAVFVTINLLFKLEGQLDSNKVLRAVDLALNKYCSVQAMLRSSVTISHQVRVNGMLLDLSSSQ